MGIQNGCIKGEDIFRVYAVGNDSYLFAIILDPALVKDFHNDAEKTERFILQTLKEKGTQRIKDMIAHYEEKGMELALDDTSKWYL